MSDELLKELIELLKDQNKEISGLKEEISGLKEAIIDHDSTQSKILKVQCDIRNVFETLNEYGLSVNVQ